MHRKDHVSSLRPTEPCIMVSKPRGPGHRECVFLFFSPSPWVGPEVPPLSAINQATLSQFYFPDDCHVLLQRGGANWFLWNCAADTKYQLTLQPLIKMWSVIATDKLHGGESAHGLDMWWEQKAVSPCQPGAWCLYFYPSVP